MDKNDGPDTGRAIMSAGDWQDLLGSQDSQAVAAAVLSAPFSDEEYDQAMNEEMESLQAYYAMQEAAGPLKPGVPHPSAEKAATASPVKPEAPKVSSEERLLAIYREVREENKTRHLGLDQSGVAKEANRRLRAEIEAGKVKDPALEGYDPGDYILNTSPDFYSPVIEGMLNRRTINEINGDAGAGKTTLLVQMAVSLATSRPLFGCFRVTHPGVSVFFTEDPDSVEMQVAAWSLKLGVNLREWIKVFKRPADLMEPSKLRIQKARIMTFAGERPVNLLVFDSKMFHLSVAKNNGLAMDENSNTDQQLITTAGHRFAESLDAAGIFIPHVSKSSSGSGHFDLESRGGSAAKGAVYKTFSLVRERVQTGTGAKASIKETGYTVLSVGKARQGGLKGRFKLKGYQTPVFAGDVEKAKREKYESCFAPDQEPERPDFIRIDNADRVWFFEEQVYDMDAGKEDEHFDAEERRESHRYTPLQQAVYSFVRACPDGTSSYREIVDRLSGTVFKDNNEPYSKEAIRSAVRKMCDLAHLSQEVNPENTRDPWYTVRDCISPQLGSCAD